MRKIGALVATLGLAALVAAPARAQGPRGGMGMGMYGPNLLTNKGVQKELKLSDEQVSKVQALAEETRTKMREKFNEIPEEERREKAPALMREFNSEFDGKLKDVLKDDQRKRFDQIQLQVRGADALNDAEVQKKLSLNDEQKSKLKDIQQEVRQKRQEIFQNANGDFQAVREKMQELQKETKEKAFALLTDDQKKSWKEMTGSPFEYRPEGGPGGPGGGRRRQTE